MITLKNKKILLLGLGLHGGGAATARWLHSHGAKLIVSDIKKSAALRVSLDKLSKLKGIQYVLGKHRAQDVEWCDYVVYNPGVSNESKSLRLARQLKKPIYNEASLFFDRCAAPVIAVTGTRGKSTTASLIVKMCQEKNPRTILAGNIKTTFMLDIVDRAKKDDLVVLELSSWQLEGMDIVKAAPHIAVITNLYPDHLNRYKNLTNYYCSKKEIFRHQNKGHYIVLNDEDKVLRKWQKEVCSRTYVFSKKTHKGHGAFIKNGKIIFKSATTKNSPSLEGRGPGGRLENAVVSVKDVKLKGEHNLENALAAITAAKIYGVGNTAIKKVLKSELILEGRQQIIAKKKGVTFVNDTTATTPIACIAALKRFGNLNKKNIILIAGGADKNLGYSDWAKQVKKYCKQVYLFVGDASQKQKKALSSMSNLSAGHNNMQLAVSLACANAKKGDIILLSPGAASFNLWQHEFERGEDFVRATLSSRGLN